MAGFDLPGTGRFCPPADNANDLGLWQTSFAGAGVSAVGVRNATQIPVSATRKYVLGVESPAQDQGMGNVEAKALAAVGVGRGSALIRARSFAEVLPCSIGSDFGVT